MGCLGYYKKHWNKEISIVYKKQWQLKGVIQLQVQIFTTEEDQQHSPMNAAAVDTPFFHDANNKFICYKKRLQAPIKICHENTQLVFDRLASKS